MVLLLWLSQHKERRRMQARTPEGVVVTGASAGVGRAIVRAFAKRGASIGLLALGHEGLEGARRNQDSFE
jgi:NADP-dependent 3-hydroxy acid dehydrogenase YdfG